LKLSNPLTSYVLGGGCFWCLDAIYRQLKGVVKVESGYSGGQTIDPDYYQVVTGATGHAEVVRVTFDELIIPSSVVLDVFFAAHDPTSLNRQGADIGTQYRSIMLYADDVQKNQFKQALNRASAQLDKPIVTEVVPLESFYLAEAEHQDYFNKQPAAGYCSIVIAPKMTQVRAKYTGWFN